MRVQRPASLLLVLSLAFATPLAALTPPTVEWSWRAPLAPPSQVSAPLVVRIVDHDGDGDVDLADPADVLVTLDEFDTDGASLVALDGRTGALLWTSPVVTHDYWLPAAGDLDGVPGAEIVIVDAEDRLACLDGRTGALLWRNAVADLGGGAHQVSLANVDAAGPPEIVVGRTVFDASGEVLFRLESDADSDLYGRVETIPVDLLPHRPGLELLIGNVLWDSAGAVLWEHELDAWRHRVRPGYVAVADLDLDRRPEILSANRLPPGATSTMGPTLDVRGDDGQLLGQFDAPPGGQIAAPTVANIDDDPEPEVLLAAATELFALRWQAGSPGVEGHLIREWSVPTSDPSCCSRASAFDLDGDGVAEVLYSDHESFLVLDGRTGFVLHQEPWNSGTRWEAPVVVNLDDDPWAEVVLVGIDEVRVLEWPGSATPRCVWNELAYHDVNVLDDGTIPIIEPPTWRDGGTWGSQVAGACGSATECRTWDDLLDTIAAAEVDDPGVRNSLRAKVLQARRQAGHPRAAAPAGQLCALLRELAAQAVRHVEPASADTIAACTRSVAASQGIALSRCDPLARLPAHGERGTGGGTGRERGGRRR